MMFTMIFVQVSTIVGALLVYRNRKNFSYSNLSLAAAGLVSALVLSSPAIGTEWSDRLTGLSFAPLAICFILLGQVSGTRWGKVVVASTAGLALAASLFLVQAIKQPVLSDNQYASFQAVSKAYAIPENSIVVAGHGLEYLAAWVMKTDIVEDTFYDSTDLKSYSHVYYLTRRLQGPGGYAQNLGAYSSFAYGYQSAAQGPIEITGDLVFENANFKLVKVR